MKLSDKLFVRVTGEHARFTIPAFAAEPVTYPCMTPSAAVGLLEAIYWKPWVTYRVEEIFVEKPIRTFRHTVNEVKSVTIQTKKADRDEAVWTPRDASDSSNRIVRNTSILYDVSYVIVFRIESEGQRGVAMDADILTRRIRKGQYYRTPCLGCANMPASSVDLLKGYHDIPRMERPINLDLGRMMLRREWLPNTHQNGVWTARKDAKPVKVHYFDAKIQDSVLRVS